MSKTSSPIPAISADGSGHRRRRHQAFASASTTAVSDQALLSPSLTLGGATAGTGQWCTGQLAEGVARPLQCLPLAQVKHHFDQAADMRLGACPKGHRAQRFLAHCSAHRRIPKMSLDFVYAYQGKIWPTTPGPGHGTTALHQQRHMQQEAPGDGTYFSPAMCKHHHSSCSQQHSTQETPMLPGRTTLPLTGSWST